MRSTLGLCSISPLRPDDLYKLRVRADNGRNGPSPSEWSNVVAFRTLKVFARPSLPLPGPSFVALLPMPFYPCSAAQHCLPTVPFHHAASTPSLILSPIPSPCRHHTTTTRSLQELPAQNLDFRVPKRWLRVDIADIVQKHLQEEGGEPPEFFRQMVAALRPHVAMLKRVFIGMSLSGQAPLHAVTPRYVPLHPVILSHSVTPYHKPLHPITPQYTPSHTATPRYTPLHPRRPKGASSPRTSGRRSCARSGSCSAKRIAKSSHAPSRCSLGRCAACNGL